MHTPTRSRDAHWRQRAACRDADPAQFDDVEKSPWPPARAVEAALDYCRRCPVRTACRAAATLGDVPGTGVWGGRWHHRPGKPDSCRPIEVSDLLGPEYAPRATVPEGLSDRQGDVWQALPVVGFTTTGALAEQTRMDQRHTSQVLAILASRELAWSPTRGVWRRATPADEMARVAS